MTFSGFFSQSQNVVFNFSQTSLRFREFVDPNVALNSLPHTQTFWLNLQPFFLDLPSSLSSKFFIMLKVKLQIGSKNHRIKNRFLVQNDSNFTSINVFCLFLLRYNSLTYNQNIRVWSSPCFSVFSSKTSALYNKILPRPCFCLINWISFLD